MENEISIIKIDEIKRRIFTFRSIQVMIDRDLAELYNVQTKRLNQQVNRNKDRFPEEFCFQLTEIELNDLMSQNATSNLRSQNATSSLNSIYEKSNSKHGGRRYLPYVFTEQGVAMLSAVLKSETAVKVSVQIINAFVEMRKFIASNMQIFSRLDSVEHKQLSYQIESDQKFEQIFNALQANTKDVRQGIFFNGQIYDSYSFVIQLIKKAQKEIIIIDNYIDNTILDMLTKKKKAVSVIIITKPETKLNTNDIQQFNKQYPSLNLKYSNIFHDRFIIIDKKLLYHIGASLKDLGKKCFAFSILDEKELLNKLLGSI